MQHNVALPEGLEGNCGPVLEGTQAGLLPCRLIRLCHARCGNSRARLPLQLPMDRAYAGSKRQPVRQLPRSGATLRGGVRHDHIRQRLERAPGDAPLRSAMPREAVELAVAMEHAARAPAPRMLLILPLSLIKSCLLFLHLLHRAVHLHGVHSRALPSGGSLGRRLLGGYNAQLIAQLAAQYVIRLFLQHLLTGVISCQITS
jgi:hypothetical protein